MPGSSRGARARVGCTFRARLRQVRKGRQQRKLRLQAEDGVKRLEGEAAAAHAEVQVRMRRAADRVQRG
jgi:hypothetical protein